MSLVRVQGAKLLGGLQGGAVILPGRARALPPAIQEGFFNTEEEGRTMRTQRSKVFGASRKKVIKHRAKRNGLRGRAAGSSSLVPV